MANVADRIDVTDTAAPACALPSSYDANGIMLLLDNKSGESIYWGWAGTVTVANGFEIADGRSFSWVLKGSNRPYVIADDGGGNRVDRAVQGLST